MAIGTLLAALLTFTALANAQTWTALNNQPSFEANTALLLTDGTVMVQSYLSGAWWRLTPDNTGSYIHGTWSQLASMPSGYGPLYYASAVLPDGRVVVEGGEYNLTSQVVETKLGAIYDPAANTWTSITAPSTWSAIGDAQGAVLPNGTFMLGNCGYPGSICSPFQLQQALLNASNLTWTITGTGKADQSSEEGWTLLPSGNVLTVDVWNGTESELYNPSAAGSWSLAGSTVMQLPNTNCDEIGPAVLRPDGTVFATGGTSNSAIYNTTTSTWSAGPSFPSGYGVADGPAALLPDGNVLVQTGPISSSYPYCYNAGSLFYEFNGTSLTSVPGPPNAPNDPSYVGRMLVLPTGQILFTDGTTNVEIYTPAGTYSSAWQPTISSYPSTVAAGSFANSISGTQFNGLSQGAMYGDDAQMATNYPLVQITNSSTGHVFYAKTHNHSTMGVATGTATVSTEFDVPGTIETGASTLEVVANGIPSNPVAVTVLPPNGTFAYTGNMTTARENHAASLLNNGMVLVSGGDYSSCSIHGCTQIPLSSAELYNATNATFSATGSMTTARLSHTSTPLNNGMVLVAGGENNSTASSILSSAELYSPATGTFSAAGYMTAMRTDHTATLLNNGLVLIAGGISTCGSRCGTDVLSSAELYNPATGTFTATGNMTTARAGHTATLLNNGMVLITGGCSSSTAVEVPCTSAIYTAELYNPATGTFTATGNMTTARASQTATLLNNGMVLVSGGYLPCRGFCQPYLSSAELYNPTTGAFIATGSMNTSRAYHTATLLSDETVLLAGGYGGGLYGSASSFLSSAELYNPSAESFSYTASLLTVLDFQTATPLSNGTVLIAGGAYGNPPAGPTQGSATSSAELYSSTQ